MSESSRSEQLVRFLLAVGFAVVAAVTGYVVLVRFPDGIAEFLGVLATVGLVVVALRIAGNVADARFPGYNVAEVAVEGPITRDGGSSGPLSRAVGAGADEIVEQIERADDDPHAEALLMKLNTPGGEVVPSDDIRKAAADFDGPTVAYATDTCASGGYWIASGCDELWAREMSVVGSIGVIGSRPNVSGLMDKLGVEYERLAAGDYKDAGLPIKEMTDDEREYLQGIIDGFYDDFVERVAEGRDMDPEAVRDTEARVYLGSDARDVGLVDELGDEDDVRERVGEELGAEAEVREFEPKRRLTARVGLGARKTAYAFGAGVGSALAPDDEFDVRF